MSVVVPAWNAERFLRDAVRSALEQSYPVHEVVIVDDGSTDATATVAEELSALDDRVRLVRRVNGGPGAARDEGIAQVTGTLVALLDADDVWLPEKLERQVAVLADDDAEHVGAVFCIAQNVFDGVPPAGPVEPMRAYIPSAMVARRADMLANGLFAATGDLADWVPWFLRFRERVAIDCVDELLVHRRVHDQNLTRRHGNERAEYVRHVGEALRRRRAARASKP